MSCSIKRCLTPSEAGNLQYGAPEELNFHWGNCTLKSRKFSPQLDKATELFSAGVGYKFLLIQETPHPAWCIHSETPEILFPFLSLRNSQQK